MSVANDYELVWSNFKRLHVCFCSSSWSSAELARWPTWSRTPRATLWRRSGPPTSAERFSGYVGKSRPELFERSYLWFVVTQPQTNRNNIETKQGDDSVSIRMLIFVSGCRPTRSGSKSKQALSFSNLRATKSWFSGSELWVVMFRVSTVNHRLQLMTYTRTRKTFGNYRNPNLTVSF